MIEVYLKKGEGRALKSGGMWIYDNEIDHIDGCYAGNNPKAGKFRTGKPGDPVFDDGDIVAVRDFDGWHLGTGFINTWSVITVRMLSRYTDEVDEAFIRRRVRDAYTYRCEVMDFRPAEDTAAVNTAAGACDRLGSCRLIFGEADFLPGIVIDRFSDVLVVESLARGIDRLKGVILGELLQLLAADGIRIRGIYERSDAPVRRKEGMEPFTGFLDLGTFQPAPAGETLFDTNVEIEENGVRYIVDVRDGQKTGFFLDQKYNRLAIHRICRGARVLDCFTHTGAFALNAGLAGAREVTGVDASDLAVHQARENAALNGLSDRVSFRTADVFELLPELEKKGEQYDVVILDPPAFTKSRDTVRRAVKGYREINLRGLRLVRDGGYLVTCSCSHFMDPELFAKTIREAAASARRRLTQVEFRTQAPDHPILWAADESYYLKFYIFKVSIER